MKLLRVQVPDYKVLKNVDITFEKEFDPQVFPIGGFNGSGKSTLLRLIFSLLNCFSEETSYVLNRLLTPKMLNENLQLCPLAVITVLDNKNQITEIKFEFGAKELIKEATNGFQIKTVNIHNDEKEYAMTASASSGCLDETFKQLKDKVFLLAEHSQNRFFVNADLPNLLNFDFLYHSYSHMSEKYRHLVKQFEDDCKSLEVQPEDLSSGELIKFLLYYIIKNKVSSGSIVLIDGIENSFHPDWQRHIVDDLVEWGKYTQYILASHSYELCRGVTVGHVKNIDKN